VNVLIIGNLFAPGNYSITPVSTIIYALLRAGGPDKLGTFRNIKVITTTGKETNIDLYDYYVYGKSPKQIQFNDGDIIFVPSIGKVVGVAGAVKRPAIYELKEGEGLKEIMEMCGGLLPEGYVGKITIYGAKEHMKMVVYEKDYNSEEEFRKMIKDVKLNSSWDWYM
jgi:polysaccharide export outer membrane protein